MLKFFTGTAMGALLAFVFVRFGLEPPAIVKLPEKLKANLVTTAVEADLYDLNAAGDVHERALKIYFDNRAGDAAKLDAAAGHPFLAALHRERARREARELNAAWSAYDDVLARPALRATLERKYGTSKDDALKRAMLMDALGKGAFLKAWLERGRGEVTVENVRAVLVGAAKLPPP
ncbi:MAG: hypothetical protein HOP13_09145 [Alphaproteobacteria bacterium]|nr:hypothetical protein [Alphaproteobacteria bacterium]